MGRKKSKYVPPERRIIREKPCWEEAKDLASKVVDNWAYVVTSHSTEMEENYRENISKFDLYEGKFVAKLTAWYKVFGRYASRIPRIWAESYTPRPPR